MKKLKTLFLISALSILQGCLYISMKKQVVSDEAARVPVKFESAEAASLFKASLEKMSSKENPCFGEDALLIPFIVFTSREVYYETACFNRQVRLVDINQDGVVTVEEVMTMQ